MAKDITPTTQVAIQVKDIHKSFKLPHESHSGVKQLLINAFRRDKRKGYENQQVLRGISFDIYKGDFFGIVGRNGSGKSTLLKILAGIYTPDSGGISVNGTLVPFIELGVGFNPELSGRDNVYLNGALLGFSKLEMDSMYREIVEFAELERFMDQKLKNYSSGMQVRLAFSIAIRADSDILILDEVLAVGDAAFQQKSFNFFEKIKRSGKTIVLVTHDMASVNRFCNRALLIDKGRVKVMGSPDEVAEQYTVDNIDKKVGDSPETEAHKQIEITFKNEGGNTLEPTEPLRVSATFTLDKPIDVYIGLSISKNGTSVAEINSLEQDLFTKRPRQKQQAFIDIDLKAFNPGLYTLNGAMFSKEDRALIASTHNAFEFFVKGTDETRGGALKIENSWYSGKD